MKRLIVMLVACPLMVNGIWANAHLTNDHQGPHETALIHVAHDHNAHDHGHVTDHHGHGQQDAAGTHDAAIEHDADHDPASHVHLCYMALLSVEREYSRPPGSIPGSLTFSLVGRTWSPPVPPPNALLL